MEYLKSCLETRVKEPSNEEAMFLWMNFTPDLKKLIRNYGYDDSEVRRLIDDELDNLI